MVTATARLWMMMSMLDSCRHRSLTADRLKAVSDARYSSPVVWLISQQDLLPRYTTAFDQSSYRGLEGAGITAFSIPL